MGQYHIAACLDTREFISPHQLGDGLKVMEQACSDKGGVGSALIVLLAVSNGRGGGDLHYDPHGIAGRWGGKRALLIGDYAEAGDYVPQAGDPQPDQLYHLVHEADDECAGTWCEGKHFTNITPLVIETFAEDPGMIYVGDGWKTRVSLYEAIEGLQYTHNVGGRRVAKIGDRDYPVADIAKAVAALPEESVRSLARGGKTTIAALGLKPAAVAQIARGRG